MRITQSVSRSTLAIVIAHFFLSSVLAEVKLPKIFANHMVLQRDKPLVVWGWSTANETLTVKLASESLQVNANERGEWKAVLPAMKAGGPFSLEVSGSSVVRFEDVLVGEIWLCSGQSNMEMGIGAWKDG